MNEWLKLFEEAKKVLNPREISGSIDAACSLGMCAERNAIGTMITNGENEITKILCVGRHDDNIMMPCGACRELLLQICENNKKAQVITDLKTFKSISLIDLMPNWWK